MRVLFIIEAAFNPNRGGVQHTTYKLGKFFHENGLDVHYLSLSTNDHIESEYGTLHHVFHSGRAKKKENMLYMRNIIQAVKPDIIINQYPYDINIRSTIYELRSEIGYKILGCLRNSLFSFKDNISFIVEEMHDGILLKLVNNNLGLIFVQIYHYLKHRRNLKRILDKHDYFILLAPPNKEDLEYFVGKYKTEKVKAIPNSIPRIFDFKPDEKDKILLYVGRLDVKQKRADLLTPIWQQLQPAISDWRFIIVGDGPYKEKLDAEIEEKNLTSIKTVGYQDPGDYYQKASILVMPSAFEGFPNVLLEAQSHSVVPVLFDSYSSVSWVVEDGKNALLAEPFQVDQVADKIKYLAQNSDRLREISYASNLNARRFSIEKVGKMWLNFFDEIRQ